MKTYYDNQCQNRHEEEFIRLPMKRLELDNNNEFWNSRLSEVEKRSMKEQKGFGMKLYEIKVKWRRKTGMAVV